MLRRVPSIARKPFLATWSRSYISTDEIFGDKDPDEPNAHNRKSVKNFKASPVARKIKGKFVCEWTKETNKTFFNVVKLLATSRQRLLNLPNVPDSAALLKTVVPDRNALRSTSEPHFTWLGHASCYFQTEGSYFLTDPMWSQRASPLSFLGPKRFQDVPIEIEDLNIDVVMLSHTHYDHLDIRSAKRIGNRATWLVPLGVGKILKSIGITNCVEMDWWDSYHHLTKSGSNIEIMFVPSKHWTSRTPFDRNTCLWGGFALMGRESKFYFAGDTAYASVFDLIGRNLGPFDLAAIPIGAYTPRWFMKNVHCNPEEAMRIQADLRAKQAVGIHWGTFPLTEEDPVEPALELARVRDMMSESPSKFFTMALGETLRVGADPRHDFASLHPEHYQHYLEFLRKLK